MLLFQPSREAKSAPLTKRGGEKRGKKVVDDRDKQLRPGERKKRDPSS